MNLPGNLFFFTAQNPVKSCVFPCPLPLPGHHCFPSSTLWLEKSQILVGRLVLSPHVAQALLKPEDTTFVYLYRALTTTCRDVYFPSWIVAPPSSFLAPRAFLDFRVCYIFLAFLGIWEQAGAFRLCSRLHWQEENAPSVFMEVTTNRRGKEKGAPPPPPSGSVALLLNQKSGCLSKSFLQVQWMER